VIARACLVLLVLDLTLQAADWPEFRGPTGQGHAETTNLPAEWSTTKNVVWKQEVAGLGWSSPIVVSGRIYLTTAAAIPNSKDLSLRALCLEAASGKQVWDKEVFRESAQAPRPHTKNSHASPTPICRDSRLYVHFGHQGTACLDLDGKILWKNATLKYAPVHGNGGSPILVDDPPVAKAEGTTPPLTKGGLGGLLVFSCDGSDQQFIVALDVKTGKPRWKTDRRSTAAKTFSFSTPLLIEVNGKQQVVSPASDMVAGYDPVTGKEIWRVRTQGYSVIPRPVFAHGLIFMSSGYESPTLMAIRPDGTGDVTATHVAWETKRNAPHTPSPLVVGDELYVVSDGGMATCLEAKTGKVHWLQRLGGKYSASPLFADGKIYFQSEEGVGTVVKPGTEFQQLAKNRLEEQTLASYAVADGALFIRSEKHLYRIENHKSP
jgi:outer membrane protein assembly factor BamB